MRVAVAIRWKWPTPAGPRRVGGHGRERLARRPPTDNLPCSLGFCPDRFDHRLRDCHGDRLLV